MSQLRYFKEFVERNLDSKPQVYYTIRRADGSERQTVKKLYLDLISRLPERDLHS